MDSMVGYGFVLVDDFGTSRQTEYAQEQIFGVIDAIYRAKIPVVITSNLSLKDLEHPESLSDTRLFDRVLSMCPVRVCVDGPSRRKAEADRRTQLARELLL